ncbi:hypothetical protein JR316_0001535 [Psilocybe cubensis]|nr:hypothetical protein JR316_0001535 [Psilocybe cubensis]KAH9487459.1 hypothetical protein JR316_0001535 [Psilocybe cubensis]
MSDGTHTLTITNKLAATDPFFLDFLFVLDADPDSTVTGGLPTLSSAIPGSSTSSSTTASSTSVSSSSSSSSSSSVSSTSTTASSTTSEFQTNTITVTSTPPPPSASTIADSANNNAGDVGAAKKSNAGAIVGGVIAGIVVLAFLVFGLFYWNRKRQRRHSFLDYKAAGSQSYWNRPLEAAATPSSAPPPQTTEPFTPTPPRAPMMTRNDTASSLSVSTYGQPQTAYTQGYSQAQTPGYGSQGYTPAPAGYMPPTPGPDYYESSDLAYAVNPGPPSAGPGYGYGQGIGQGAGYGQGYTDSRESDIYAAPQVQPAQGYGGTGGYIPPSQLLQHNAGNSSGYYSAQNQPGQRARTRLD